MPVAQLDRALDSDSGGCRREFDNKILVPVAQLDRVSASGAEGLGFESRQARHLNNVMLSYIDEKRVFFAGCPVLCGESP